MSNVLVIIGLILVVIGFIGGIKILVLAFKKSVWWGLGSLFVPFVSLIFVIRFWSEAKKPFFLSLASIPAFALLVMGPATQSALSTSRDTTKMANMRHVYTSILSAMSDLPPGQNSEFPDDLAMVSSDTLAPLLSGVTYVSGASDSDRADGILLFSSADKAGYYVVTLRNGSTMKVTTDDFNQLLAQTKLELGSRFRVVEY